MNQTDPAPHHLNLLEQEARRLREMLTGKSGGCYWSIRSSRAYHHSIQRIRRLAAMLDENQPKENC